MTHAELPGGKLTAGVPSLSGRDAAHFHLLDPTLADEFWPRVNALREACPVTWSDQPWSEDHAGFWVVNDYEKVMSVATDWRTFSSADGASPVQFDLDLLRMVPLETDPPLHRRIRRALNPFFTPEALKIQDETIAATVSTLLDACIARGRSDLVADFANRLPPLIFFDGFLGQKQSEIGWVLDTLDILMSAPERAIEVIGRLLIWEAGLLESRRQEGRRDDLAGTIAHLGLTGEDGLELDEQARVETLNLMIMAGMETTMAGIASAAYLLASNPDLRARIRDGGEDLLDRAVEEILRRESPIPAAGRTLTTTTEVGGATMTSGQRLMINWAAANRDPAHFPEPDALDLERKNLASHVAFGAGIHRCLGNHLARREIKASIRAFSELSRFDLEPGFVPRYRRAMVRGPLSLPLRLSR